MRHHPLLSLSACLFSSLTAATPRARAALPPQLPRAGAPPGRLRRRRPRPPRGPWWERRRRRRLLRATVAQRDETFDSGRGPTDGRREPADGR
jgi:hypothetical protein